MNLTFDLNLAARLRHLKPSTSLVEILAACRREKLEMHWKYYSNVILVFCSGLTSGPPAHY